MEKERDKEESDDTGNNEEFNLVEDTPDGNCLESSEKKESSTDDMDQSETEMKD
jgi:hypothetical protein